MELPGDGRHVLTCFQSCFGQNLVYGGPAVVIFGLIIAFFVQGFISLGLGELASAFPVSTL